MSHSRRRAAVYAALAISLSFAVGATPHRVAGASASSGPILTKETVRFLDDSLRGYSGKLLARFVDARRPSAAATAFFRLFGNPSDVRPGIYLRFDAQSSLFFHRALSVHGEAGREAR